jgi:2-polyprenyl-3-methyl-5-hydroxy-6-metoxy-1,4-benzoquinol methylase
MELPVYTCSECGLFVTGGSEEEVREKSKIIYSGRYWEERQAIQSLESDFKDKASLYKWKHWRSQMEYCKPYFQDKKEILEIGSGAGWALFYFEGKGHTATGIEPDPRNVELINKKLKKGHCINGYIEDMTIDGIFDVIWISHVFEHLIRPDLLLKKCKANLRNNGIVFIEVPECENPRILRESIYDNPSSFHFTKRTLSNVVKNAGYKILRCDSLRIPTLIEAGMMKAMRRVFGILNYTPYPYYPRIITDKNDGQMVRMIIGKS